MKFVIDNAGEGNQFVAVEHKDNYIELSSGFNESARRASVTGISREHALALARALHAMAKVIPKHRGADQ